jgi:hypothetical protein
MNSSLELTRIHNQNSQFVVGAPGQKITGTLNDLDRYHPCTHRDPHPIGLIAIIAEMDCQKYGLQLADYAR